MNTEQLLLLGRFALLGVVAAGAYDVLRALRTECRHALAVIMVEDSLFVLVVLAACYALLWQYNRGALRLYCFLGLGGGWVLQAYTIGRFWRLLWQKLWHLFLFPLKKMKQVLTRVWKWGNMRRSKRKAQRCAKKEAKRAEIAEIKKSKRSNKRRKADGEALVQKRKKRENCGIFRGYQSRKPGASSGEEGAGH